MPPDYVARRAVTLLGSGPTGGVMGAAARRDRRRRRRLRRRRHGRHQLRHLPRARRPARDQDRLELALPLLHRPADGRRAERRRRRRLDRPGAPGRAARRPGDRPARCPGPSATAGAARGRPSPTPTPCSATSPSRASPAGACTLDVDAARGGHPRDVAEPLGLDVDRGGVGHRAHRQRQHGQRHPPGARRATAPTRATSPSSPTAATARCTRAAIAAELGIDRILVPKAAPAFSALGVLVADYVVDLVRSYVTPLRRSTSAGCAR